MKYFPFIMAAFSALRLAKFNIDPRQEVDFIGVPTPANALMICSFPLLLHFHLPTLLKFSDRLIYIDIIYHPGFLCGLSLVMSLLLISEIRLFSMKFKDFSWKNNANRFIFMLVATILIATFQFNATPIIIVFYILWSVIWYKLIEPRIGSTNKKATPP
jgi:CDP-diacylglycerol--serine O-phosphatidyltransferase